MGLLPDIFDKAITTEDGEHYDLIRVDPEEETSGALGRRPIPGTATHAGRAAT